MDAKQLDVLWKRLSSAANVDALPYGEAVTIGGVFGDMKNTILEQQKEIEEYKKTISGTDIKFMVEDEEGYKYGSFSKPEDAKDHAQMEADDRRIDFFIKKVTTEIVYCVIPD